MNTVEYKQDDGSIYIHKTILQFKICRISLNIQKFASQKKYLQDKKNKSL